jgi:hypothetical protein
LLNDFNLCLLNDLMLNDKVQTVSNNGKFTWKAKAAQSSQADKVTA